MPTIDSIKLFFSPAYFFNPYPSYDMKYMSFMIGFFVVLLLVVFVLFTISKRNRKNKPLKVYLGSLINIFFWTAVIGFILLFFRYEGIAFVSSRALLFLLVLTFVFWTIYLIVFGRKKYKKEVKEFQEKKEKEKYFKRK